MVHGFWTEEKDDLLIKLYHEDHSYNELVNLIGCSTKNQIAGRINYLTLKGKMVRKAETKQPKSLRKKKKDKPTVELSSKQLVVEPVPVVEETPELLIKNANVTTQYNHLSEYDMDLDFNKLRSVLDGSKCMWPVITEGRKHLFCYHSRKSGSSYCEGHSKQAYTGAPPPTGGHTILPQLGAKA